MMSRARNLYPTDFTNSNRLMVWLCISEIAQTNVEVSLALLLMGTFTFNVVKAVSIDPIFRAFK